MFVQMYNVQNVQTLNKHFNKQAFSRGMILDANNDVTELQVWKDPCRAS